MNDDAEAIASAIRRGANVNARLDNDTTALHIAASLDRVASLKQLITLGADFDARDYCGHTPLHECAALSRTPESVAALLAAGADVNARTSHGSSAIDRTVGHRRLENAILLLRAGAYTSRTNAAWLVTVRRGLPVDEKDQGRS